MSDLQQSNSPRSRRWRIGLVAVFVVGSFRAPDGAAQTTNGSTHAAQAYLELLENFAGFAEQYWNEKAESYDAAGAGVTWARGNGGMCLTYALLLTEHPD